MVRFVSKNIETQVLGHAVMPTKFIDPGLENKFFTPWNAVKHRTSKLAIGPSARG